MTITNKNYHDLENKRLYFSPSQWKMWLTCESQAKAYIDGIYKPEPSDAMLVGSYVDRALTAPDELDEFVATNKSDFKPAMLSAGKAMVKRLQDAPMWQMIAKKAQFQPILLGKIAGQDWSYMADIVMPSDTLPVLLDLKTASDFDEDWVKDCDGKNIKANWIEALGYWRQLSVGRHLYHQKHEVYPSTGIVGVKKPSRIDAPIGLGLWVMDDAERMDREIARIAELTPHIVAVKCGEIKPTECGKCAWCLSQSNLSEERVAISQRLWTV